MPLVRILYNRYWSTPSMYNEMNAFLQNEGYTVLDARVHLCLPGRPIAIAGPNRTVPAGSDCPVCGGKHVCGYVYLVHCFQSRQRCDTEQPDRSADDVQCERKRNLRECSSSRAKAWCRAIRLLTCGNHRGESVRIWSCALNNPLRLRYDLPISRRYCNGRGPATCITCHTPAPAGQFATFADHVCEYRPQRGWHRGWVGGQTISGSIPKFSGASIFPIFPRSPLLRKPSGHHHNGLVQVGFGNKGAKIPADQLATG